MRGSTCSVTPTVHGTGLTRGTVPAVTVHSSSQPMLSASALLPASSQAVVRKAELARPPSRSRPPLPSSEAFLPRKPNKATVPVPKLGAADQADVSGSPDCGSVVVMSSAVQVEDLKKAANPQQANPAQGCGMAASTVVEDGTITAESPVETVTMPAAIGEVAHHTAASCALGADSTAASTAESSATVQQQQSCSTQADLSKPKHAVSQKRPEQQGSRPSTAASRQGGPSPFDRRLALLHKGLPTHMPCPDPSRPPTRSRRPATQPSLLRTPSGLAHSPSMLPGTSTAGVANARGDASLQAGVSSAEPAAGATCSQDLGTGALGAAARSKACAMQSDAPASAAAASRAGLLGKDGGHSLSKPSSPTSVLTNEGLGDTTYHSFFGLADAYPELYREAAAAGQAHKANSRALQSLVGETLKGNPDLWKQQLQSAYSVCNDRLKQDAVSAVMRSKSCLFHCLSCCQTLIISRSTGTMGTSSASSGTSMPAFRSSRLQFAFVSIMQKPHVLLFS